LHKLWQIASKLASKDMAIKQVEKQNTIKNANNKVRKISGS
jgi:hypothetical protein